jgi:hypothetical protein
MDLQVLWQIPVDIQPLVRRDLSQLPIQPVMVFGSGELEHGCRGQPSSGVTVHSVPEQVCEGQVLELCGWKLGAVDPGNQGIAGRMMAEIGNSNSRDVIIKVRIHVFPFLPLKTSIAACPPPGYALRNVGLNPPAVR